MNPETLRRNLQSIDRLLAELAPETPIERLIVRQAVQSSLQRHTVVRCPYCDAPHTDLDLVQGAAVELQCEDCEGLFDLAADGLGDYVVTELADAEAS